MRFLIFVLLFFSVSVFTGCGNSESDVLKIVAERDSLKQAVEYQSLELRNYSQAAEMLNATLDSIAVQENMIFVGNGESPVTKENVKSNLMRFEAVLKSQQEKIRDLESQLKENGDSTNLKLIEHLNEQLRIKNVQIARLNSELEKKNVDIAQLKEQVESQRLKIESQTITISELTQRTKKQGEALARQDAMLNNGYVLIGSKSDLKRKGITRRGKLVANAALDRSKFYQVDIRDWREISFRARKPKLLTDMPSSSYEITTTGDGNYTLHVKNPVDFWRISNYLVIQTD